MTAVHLATELASPNVRVAAFIGCTIITHALGIELQKQKDELGDPGD